MAVRAAAAGIGARPRGDLVRRTGKDFIASSFLFEPRRMLGMELLEEQLAPCFRGWTHIGIKPLIPLAIDRTQAGTAAFVISGRDVMFESISDLSGLYSIVDIGVGFYVPSFVKKTFVRRYAINVLNTRTGMETLPSASMSSLPIRNAS